ncbi:MAG: efflux RND transporter periplasmic adaptor subunit [Gemmatimonadetes bacterium]|nr:efflux RND transporter periplasmic adaptor subunit [Gemmatimonadota bacterium]
MRTYRMSNGWMLAGMAAAACALSACDPGDQGQAEEPAEVFERIVNVEVDTVRVRPFTQVARLTGVARAMNDVVVSAEEGGVVRRVVRDKGRPIGAAEPILELDDAILRAQVVTATAQAALADEVWQRRRRLYEEDGIGSELSYLEAKYAAEQARGSLDALEERLARTTIRAPISGNLDARLVEVGTMVSPGTPVARIVQTDTIKILAGVPERYALEVAVGAGASVSFSVMPGEWFESSVAYAGATVDPESRTFPVELVLTNPRGQIKPEMIADIEIVLQELGDAIVVPQQALVSMESGNVVFVVEGDAADARAVARSVDVSMSQGNEVVVASGLDEGALLVVVGQQGLTDGDRVRVVDGRMTQGGGEE